MDSRSVLRLGLKAMAFAALLSASVLRPCSAGGSPGAGAGELSAGSLHGLTLPEDEPLFRIVEAAGEDSPDGLPVLRPADSSSPEAREKADLLAHSFAAQAVTIHWYAKNYLLHQRRGAEQGGPGQTALDEPTYLYLSQQEGGFARQGFWLREGSELKDMTDVPFVDIRGMSGYQFEAIFSHELAHVILGQLSGFRSMDLSTWVHETTVRTDNWAALDEGLATSLQPLASDMSAFRGAASDGLLPMRTPAPQVIRRYTGELTSGRRKVGLVGSATLTFPFWFSRVAFELRRSLVPANLFIYQPAVPDALLKADRDVYTAFLYESIASGLDAEDGRELKNAGQMLASEGVVASFFYRLLRDPSVQGNYEYPGFYDQFLRRGAKVDWDEIEPQDIFLPLENAFLKVFHVLATSVRMDADPLSTSPLLRFVEGYAREFPAERASLYRVFLGVTKGVTVDADATRIDFRTKDGTTAERFLETVERRLLKGEVHVDSNVGPQLWLCNTSFSIGLGLYDQFRSASLPYTFDLNAASVVDLRTIPRVDLELAREILRRREEVGYFRSIEDLSAVPGMRGDVMGSVRGMHSRMGEVVSRRLAHPLAGVNLSVLSILLSYLKAALCKVFMLVAGAWGMLALVSHLTRGIGDARLGRSPEGSRPVVRGGTWGGRVRRALRWLLLGLALVLLGTIAVLLVPPMSLATRFAAGLLAALVLRSARLLSRKQSWSGVPRGCLTSLKPLLPLAASSIFVMLLL